MATWTTTALRAAPRWIADRPRLTDAALGGGLTLFDAATVLNHTPVPGSWAVALWAAQTVPLLWRRRWPGAVLTAMTAVYLLFRLLDPIPGKIPGPYLLMLGVYALARYAPRRAGVFGAALCLAAVTAGDALSGHWERPQLGSLEPISTTTFVFFFALAWILGSGRRRIGADADRLRELNGRLRAEQERNARQAVAGERARIARDLHDVVAHHVSAIAVQARAAEDVLTDDPLLAVQGVGQIARTADTALVEMRRILGLLSTRGQCLAPEPSLAHLDRLADAARAAGCRVDTAVELPVDDALPAGLEVCAYRIVQESLTNVLKHAGPVAVRIAVRAAAGRLVIEVENGPPTPGHRPVPGSGRGLIGVRERAAAFDGTLDAGPQAGGGWRLRAELSVRAESGEWAQARTRAGEVPA
ncbi:sensor histidine kinase [Kitasatospora sp. NPDC092948]|uniref:sensor histidine kinase n=1 Tax=Kitasatospora sp. NPDC092948 TaxID=3364088 RepID=UPI0037FBE58E